MQFFRHQNPACPMGSVVTIGNFDGVHCGHQVLLQQLVAKAREYQVPSVVMTFEPAPAQYFGQRVPRLGRFRDKWARLADLGVDYLWCRRFDMRLAQQSAVDFITHDLLGGLQARYILVGHDFRFGHQRQGDYALLKQYANAAGVVLDTIAPVMDSVVPVSSTAIRRALAAGDFQHAQRLLGRPFTMQGRVSHGAHRGKSIGFPTANIRCARVPVVAGIFVVELQMPDGQWHAGVANLGRRPTFEQAGDYCLEVHLLHQQIDLYGQYVQVAFIKKLRDEMAFASLDALRLQIEKDVLEAGKYFNELKNGALYDNHRL